MIGTEHALNCTIVMIGVSGVGKSRLAGIVTNTLPNIVHVQASRLLKDHLATQSESLRLGNVQENQAFLVEAFKRFRIRTQECVLMDAHALVDGKNGIEVIPFEVFHSFEPAALIEVWDRPEIIAERRQNDTSRERPLRNAAQIAEHQDQSGKIGAEYATRLGVPFRRVESGDAEAAIQAIRMIKFPVQGDCKE